MKKITIISPSLKMGGIERALTVLANYFVQEGYQVYFISAQGGERFYTLDTQVHFVENNQKRSKGIFGKVYYYSLLLFFLRRTVKKQNPDVVLSFGDAFNPLVLLALVGTKYPVYISDRTSPDFPFNFFIKTGKKWLYPRAAGFIAQTERAAAYKRQQFHNKLSIKVIPNAIKQVTTHDQTPFNQIVCVGRLSVEKGQDRLLQAFSKIAPHTDWQLVLAGDGPKLQEWQNLVKALALEERVIFLGKVQDVDYLLSQSAIFVLPSRLEGFPNALCEAMAMGLPCICFDSIPTESLLTHKINGWVVKENDIDGMAQAIKELIESPATRNFLGTQAKEIASKLAISTIGKQYLEFMFQKK